MKHFLMMLACVALFSSPVVAQEDVKASLPADITALLVPSGAWLVGPTTLADGNAAEGGMPCVMVNKFSNNMELRLSGGGEEILALALNVGTPTFTADQSYLMKITFEGSAPLSLPAQAFSEDTVVVGTEPGKDFYKLLQDKQSMTIQLGESVMDFSLLGVPQSLKRLEDCFKPAAASPATAAVASSAPATPAPATSAPAAPVAAQAPTQALASVPAIAAPAEASKTLDEVSAQKVNQLMDEIKGKAASETAPPASAPASPAAAAQKAEVKQQDILAPGTATAVTGDGQQMRWRVMKGASLQNILEVWAASAQARLIWKPDQSFSVPESLAMQGTFEAAVEAVLALFPAGDKRPVGKIYQDPAIKQKILVIEMVSPAVAAPATGNYAPITPP